MRKSKLLDEFKKFALKGNMVDLAVGIIIGNSFSSLVKSVVDDLIMPVIGFITGGIDFSNKFIQLSGQKERTLATAKTVGATVAYGHFITLLINFLIIAWILFMILRAINAARVLFSHDEPEKKSLPLNEKLLTEIRDLLLEQTKKSNDIKADN